MKTEWYRSIVYKDNSKPFPDPEGVFQDVMYPPEIINISYKVTPAKNSTEVYRDDSKFNPDLSAGKYTPEKINPNGYHTVSVRDLTENPSLELPVER